MSYLGKQCAADKTQFCVMMEPPQMWPSLFVWRPKGEKTMSHLNITDKALPQQVMQHYNQDEEHKEENSKRFSQVSENRKFGRFTCKSTCHGQAPSLESIPPTILFSINGGRPHSWARELQTVVKTQERDSQAKPPAKKVVWLCTSCWTKLANYYTPLKYTMYDVQVEQDETNGRYSPVTHQTTEQKRFVHILFYVSKRPQIRFKKFTC